MSGLVIKTLETALNRNVPVLIIYQSKNAITQRSIQVVKIEGQKVRAYCHLRKRIRVFKLNHILSAQIT